MKRRTLFERVCITISFIIVALIFFDILISNPDNNSRAITKTQHFYRIEKNVVKGNTSYKLYTKENQSFYTIGATGNNCFNYVDFTAGVKIGDSLKITTNQTGLIQIPVIISLERGKERYITTDCIIRETKKDRSSALKFIIGLSIFMIFYFLYKKMYNS